MPQQEFTAKFKVDISDLKKNITEATKQIKQADDTFKNQTAGMGKWSDSAEGLAAKLGQLDKTLEAQKSVLAAYREQLTRQQSAYEENGKRADELKAKLQKLAANGVAKTDSEYKKYQQALKETLAEQQKNAKSVEDLNSKILNQETAVKTTESQIRHYAEAQEQLEKDSKSLTLTIEKQQHELDALKQEYIDTVSAEGKNSDSAKALADQIGKLSGELRDNKSTMESAQDEADKLDKSLEDVDGATETASGGFTVMKGVLSDLVASGIKAAVGALKDLANAAGEAWKEFDNGRDTVIKLTGATGEAAQSLTESYSTVSKNVLADSESIGNAIGEVNTRFGLQGEELESLSEKYLKFSEITGSDVIGTIDETQKALAAFGKDADDAAGFLDALAKTSQETGVSTSTLTSGLISNATAFEEMGLSIEQSVAFMGQLETSGANSETVLNGMRKALKNSAKDGTDLDTALISLQKQIDGSKNSTDGLNAAYELFGKSGDQIYGAIKNGTLSFEDLTKASKDSAGAVEDTYNATLDSVDKLALTIQNLKTTAAEAIDSFLTDNGEEIDNFLTNLSENVIPPIVDAVKNFVENILPDVIDAAKWLVDNGNTIIAILGGIAAGFAAFKVASLIISVVNAVKAWTIATEGMTVAQKLLNLAMNANPIGAVIALITGLVAAFVILWNKSEDFRKFWIDLWENIKSALSNAIESIKKFIGAAIQWFKDNWQSLLLFFVNPIAGVVKYLYDNVDGVRNFIDNAIKKIKEFFTSLLESIKTTFANIGDWFHKKFTEAFDGIKKAFSKFGSFFKDLWDDVKDGFTKLGTKIGDAISSSVKAGINGVIQQVENVINNAIGIINGAIGIINNIPGVSISTISPVSFPRLERGGILKKGQIGILEGTGAEAVVPLDKSKAWLSEMAREFIKQTQNGFFENVSNVNNYTQNIYAPKQPSRIELYRQSRNLFNYKMLGV